MERWETPVYPMVKVTSTAPLTAMVLNIRDETFSRATQREMMADIKAERQMCCSLKCDNSRRKCPGLIFFRFPTEQKR